MAAGRVFNFLLLPAFLLAQFICICGSRADQPAVAAHVRASTDEHACCNGGGETAPSPAEKPHQHESQCPHCTGQLGQAAVPDRVATTTIAADSFAYTLFDLDERGLQPVQARLDSYLQWLSDPSPPPDLLRVKCTLQI